MSMLTIHLIGSDNVFATIRPFTDLDIFERALTLLFFCCRYPFNDSEHASLFAKISRGFFVVPECLSSRGKCLIRSLLRREACERLSARDVLRHPWLAKDPRNELPPRAHADHDRLVPDILMQPDCL